jgi:hypothetical protein
MRFSCMRQLYREIYPRKGKFPKLLFDNGTVVNRFGNAAIHPILPAFSLLQPSFCVQERNFAPVERAVYDWRSRKSVVGSSNTDQVNSVSFVRLFCGSQQYMVDNGVCSTIFR